MVTIRRPPAPPPISVWGCDNNKCDFFLEDRRWEGSSTEKDAGKCPACGKEGFRIDKAEVETGHPGGVV